MLFQKEVVVCKKCGKKYAADFKFCPNCGEPVEGTKKIERQVFAGQVRKCPNCGTEISSYTVFCPGCGVEIFKANDANITAIKEFTNKIIEYDTKIATQKNKKRNKNNSDIDYLAEKISFIENYKFPNDRESILDALVYVKDKIVSLASNGINLSNYKWAKIWRNKAVQLYQQAELLFPEDSIAKTLYDDVENEFGKYKEKRTEEDKSYDKEKRISLIILAAILLLYVIYGLLS